MLAAVGCPTDHPCSNVWETNAGREVMREVRDRDRRLEGLGLASGVGCARGFCFYFCWCMLLCFFGRGFGALPFASTTSWGGWGSRSGGDDEQEGKITALSDHCQGIRAGRERGYEKHAPRQVRSISSQALVQQPTSQK